MEDLLKVGIIVKPQGVRGELKVQPLTDDIERFNKLKQVIIDDSTYKVLSVRLGAREVYMWISGIGDRNTAETFRGKFLHIKRSDAVTLPENTYFIVDILGCEVFFENGKKVGEVIDVTEAKTDVFTIKTVSGKIARFPFLKDLLVSVDIASKNITVSEKRYKEITVYED